MKHAATKKLVKKHTIHKPIERKFKKALPIKKGVSDA